MQDRSSVTSRSVARRPGRALGSAGTALLSPPGAGSPTSAREQGRIYPQRLPGTALRVGAPFRQGFLQPFLVSQEAPHLPNTTWPCPHNPAHLHSRGLGMKVFPSQGGRMEGLAQQAQGTSPHTGQTPSPAPQTPRVSFKGSFQPVYAVHVLHVDLYKSEGPAGDMELCCHYLMLNLLYYNKNK